MLLIAPTGRVAAQGEDEASVGFFEAYETQPGNRVEVPVQIEDVQELYGIDIEIKFDPDVIQIEDADPKASGTQPALGTFLDAGLSLFNTVDNNAGVIRFVMSQVNPSKPKSGEGNLLILYVRGLAEGESDLEITILELSTRGGEAIAAEPVDGEVTVSEAAASKGLTSIPVQDPTSMVIVPTSKPTEAPRETSTPTWTPSLTSEEGRAGGTESFESTAGTGLSSATTPTSQEPLQEKDADTQQGSEMNDRDMKAEKDLNNADDQTGFSLVRYWWIVVMVLLVAIGLGIYLVSTRKRV
jgi:hypothetical protein